MSIDQAEFAFLRDRSKPSELAEKVAAAILFLRGRDWQSAREFKARFGWSDRQVEATPEEFERGTAFLRSQSRAMLARALQIGRIWRRAGRV